MLLGVFFGQRARKKEKMNSIKTLCISFVGALVAIVIAITAVNNGWVALRSTNDLARLTDQNIQLSKELDMSRSEVENLKNSLSANIRFKTDAEGQVVELRKQLEQGKSELKKARESLESQNAVLKASWNSEANYAKRIEGERDKAYAYIAGTLATDEDREDIEWMVLWTMTEAKKASAFTAKIASKFFDEHLDSFEQISAREGFKYYWGNLGDAAFPALDHIALAYKSGIVQKSDVASRIQRMRNYMSPDDSTSIKVLNSIILSTGVNAN